MDSWSRGREVARGVLRSSPKPEKRPSFCHRGGMEFFCRLFSTQQRPNVFVSDAWRVPLTSAPRSDFMEQSLILSIDVCRGLGMSPLRVNIWLSFLRPILAHDLPRNDFFGFLKILKHFFGIFVLIASGTEIF